MNNKLTFLLIAAGFFLVAVSQTIFIVDQTQQAIVLQLGQPVGDVRQPGLHFKLPMVQEVRYYDRRIISSDPPPEQMVIASTNIRQPESVLRAAPSTPPAPADNDALAADGSGEDAEEAAAADEEAGEDEPTASPLETGTKDEIVIPPISNVSGEPIIVDSYARYRISDPLQFMKTLHSIDNANRRIESIVDEATRTVLGKTTLKELLSSDRTRVMAEINQRLNDKIKEDKMGIQIVDVRIVRADLGPSLRDSTVRRMISQMLERATETRAHGEQLALEIRSRAERERTVILAEAGRDGQIFRGEGDNTAIQTYAEAFNKDKEFYSFMRSMEAYRNTLADPDTRLILSPQSDFFRYFENRKAR